MFGIEEKGARTFWWCLMLSASILVRLQCVFVVCMAITTQHASAAELSLPTQIAEIDGFSFLGIEAKEHVDNKAQHAAAMEVAAKAGDGVSVSAMNNCQNCVYVLERIKQGYQYLLPSICVEIFSKEGASAGEKPYGVCHQVLASLSVWGNNVRHWLHYGCYKAESYGAMEIIRPCPSHIICSQMADFKKKAFCDKVKQDELVPGK